MTTVDIVAQHSIIFASATTTVNVFPPLYRGNVNPPLNETILPTQNMPFDNPSYLGTYNLIVQSEIAAVKRYCTAHSKTARDPARRDVLAARVLGFLYPTLIRMRYALGDTPIAAVSTEVASAQDNAGIYALGNMYLDLLISSFRTDNNSIPPPSRHPSRPCMDNLDDILAAAMKESSTPSDHRSARARTLARDGYRCVLSDTIDASSWEQHPAVRTLANDSGPAALSLVQPCHIFNESLVQTLESADEEDQPRRQRGAAARRILKTFGLGNLVDLEMSKENSDDAASATGIHDLRNIISLHHSLLVAFHDLKVILEPTDDGVPNKYNVVFALGGLAGGYQGLKAQVELKNFANRFKTAVEDLPLPDPRLLALHAVCARVAYMAGAGEILDEYETKIEETRMLAQDGTSADLLDVALSPHAYASAQEDADRWVSNTHQSTSLSSPQ
ncbi:hypothetical protein B0H15DRAFT_491914 [Mycena belliarum]|uniref:HNH nuclease domain-containing protein n=1 Tax=Mycena belliarum TaxID=1033014 RepID=A0AAD6TZU2_9AGAR|nr:hypothetical protein B0H15DRAFT_491914 [Mycena belliae]